MSSQRIAAHMYDDIDHVLIRHQVRGEGQIQEPVDNTTNERQ